MPDSPDMAVLTPPGPVAEAPRRPPGPSTHLALIVVGIAAILLVLGTLGAALTSNQSKPTRAPVAIAEAPGAGLVAVTARTLLAPIVSEGQPPDNILNAIAVPKGTTAVAGSATNADVSLYDQSMGLMAPDSQQAVITFVRVELVAEHWQLIDHGSAKADGAIQIIGQHPGTDGNEWELGITVSPTTYAAASAAPSTGSTGAGSGAGAGAGTDRSALEVRLFVETGDA